eukprot:5204089-Pyramimonas_sp.AAC.1
MLRGRPRRGRLPSELLLVPDIALRLALRCVSDRPGLACRAALARAALYQHSRPALPNSTSKQRSGAGGACTSRMCCCNAASV